MFVDNAQQFEFPLKLHGDGNKSRLPFQIFSTLLTNKNAYKNSNGNSYENSRKNFDESSVEISEFHEF